MTPEVLLLALAATVDPLMMGVVVLILSRPRATLGLSAYLAGGFLASAALCLALVEGLRGTGIGGIEDLPAGVRIAIGVALVAGALVIFRRARRNTTPVLESGLVGWAVGRLERAGPALAFGVGAVANLPGGYTLVAMGTIAQGHPSVPLALAQIVVFNLIMFLPAEIPLAVRIFRPESSERIVGALGSWMTRRGPVVALIVVLALGTALVVTGIGDAVG